VSALGRLVDRVSRSESGTAWLRAGQRAYLAVHRGAERAGVHVVRASYDSPIPRRTDLPADAFSRESPMRAIEWDPEAQLGWVEQELAPYLAEFRPDAAAPAEPGRFRFDNHTYDRVDADLLYAIVRALKPARVLELGSGYSSLVTEQALAANRADGRPGSLEIHDPYPSPHVLARPGLTERLRPTSAQDLPEEAVTGLGAGDVLFVDTSHTVKFGGDVNRIVLDLLPLVPSGVAVHFHDVFLPGDYSRGHLDDAHYWTEQYLVQAFLMGNPAWEVLVGGQAIVRHAPDRVAAVVDSYRPGVSPGAFWIRRR
jgi:predicted O-methyltransferase YrrM